MKKITDSCEDNVKLLKSILTSQDILVFAFETKDGAHCAAVYADGMTDKALLGEQIARPLSQAEAPKTPKEQIPQMQIFSS